MLKQCQVRGDNVAKGNQKSRLVNTMIMPYCGKQVLSRI